MKLKTAHDIGELVRNVRKNLKVTQKELATAAGIGVRFIRELEKGKPTCELAKVLLVLSMLGIRLEANVPGIQAGMQEGQP